VEKTCVPGVVKECPQGGAPKDVCPAEFVEKAPSSSSTRGSSSSSSRGSSSSSGGSNDQFYWAHEIYRYEFYKEVIKYYDPDDRNSRCQNGVVEGRCEDDGIEVWYNPLTHICGISISNDTTYIYGTWESCGSGLYPSFFNINCQNGVGIYESDCKGSGLYNAITHYCDNSDVIKAIESCNWNTSTVKAKLRCGS
jgi:hypothetical protein